MPSAPDVVHGAIMRALAHIPSTREARGDHPAARAHAIAHAAALRAAAISGSLSIPPGPAGWLTIIPDLAMVWKIQSQMVADIAGAFGKESSLAQEQMLFCLFRHAAAHSLRGMAVRSGERLLINRAGVGALEAAARKASVPVARRIAGRGVARWLPVIGAVGIAGFSYYDTIRVAATATELFQIVETKVEVIE